jgi:hypothetical protein
MQESQGPKYQLAQRMLFLLLFVGTRRLSLNNPQLATTSPRTPTRKVTWGMNRVLSAMSSFIRAT